MSPLTADCPAHARASPRGNARAYIDSRCIAGVFPTVADRRIRGPGGVPCLLSWPDSVVARNPILPVAGREEFLRLPGRPAAHQPLLGARCLVSMRIPPRCRPCRVTAAHFASFFARFCIASTRAEQQGTPLLLLPSTPDSPHSPQLVRIDDEWFDLSRWRKAHPAGTHWIDLYKNQV